MLYAAVAQKPQHIVHFCTAAFKIGHLLLSLMLGVKNRNRCCFFHLEEEPNQYFFLLWVFIINWANMILITIKSKKGKTIKIKENVNSLGIYITTTRTKYKGERSGGAQKRRKRYHVWYCIDPIEGHSYSFLRQMLKRCFYLSNLHIQRLNCYFMHCKW